MTEKANQSTNMAALKLKLGFPCLLSQPSSPFFFNHHCTKNLFLLLFAKNNLEPSPPPSLSLSKKPPAIGVPRASVSDTSSSSGELVLDDDVISRASRLKDAGEVLDSGGGVVSCDDCRRIIEGALGCNNADLALSVLSAMLSSSLAQVPGENGAFVESWKWSRPDLSIYTSLVLGLAASLRVSDALGFRPLSSQSFSRGRGSFRYDCEMPNLPHSCCCCTTPKGYSSMHIKIQTPSGTARIHRFATETPDAPAQPGERVTIALAAPLSVYREVGPFRFSPKAPQYHPAEPLCLTNHRDGRESLLLRAPSTNNKTSLLNPSILLPLLVVLASGDAASGIIDPNLPQFLPVAAAASLAVGATLNTVVLPQLGQLPQRLVDTTAIKQQLLAQYDMLQARIKDLKDSADNEVWMLARMCQLENKIFAVGEPSYRARRNRIKRVREGLENSLRGRLELIDSYARISSMIEIEVEMDSNVPAAEASSNAENFAKEIQQIMELENLEERWRLQAEANDEVERLLSSEPLPSDQD